MRLPLRRQLKRAGAEVLMRTGALSLARRARVPGTAALLMYHRVGGNRDPFFPSLPLATFRRQLDYLERHYRIVPLTEAVSWVASGASGTPRVAVTIDDGFPDTHDCVFPELLARNLTATLFLSTGPLEDGVPLWTERLRLAFKHATRGSLAIPELGIRSSSLATVDERLAMTKRLLRVMKTLGSAAIESTLAQIVVALEPSETTHRVLSWENVRAMTSGGHVRLGGHTHRHYILSRLDDAEVEREIRTSAALIEERLGLRVDSFCYPNGGPEDYDARSLRVVRDLGIGCAVTTRNGFVTRDDSMLELPRLYTSEPHLSIFAARLAGLGAMSSNGQGALS